MPITVSETLGFVAIVRKPNNGEAADTASFDGSIPPLASRTRFLYNTTRSLQFDVTRAYAADPLGVADSTAPIQNAIDAIFAAGGGTVFFPPGTYKHTGLVLKAGVRLEGIPGASVLMLNHATNHCFTFSTSVSGELVIYGLDLEGLTANTGDVFHNVSPQVARVTLQHCWVNVIDAKLTGRFIFSNEAGSRFTLGECTVNSFIPSNFFVAVSGLLVVRGGDYTQLPAATFAMLLAGSLDVEGARFSQIKTGSADSVFLQLLASGAGFYLRARGNHFDVDVSGASAGTSAFMIFADAYINESGNTFGTNASPYLVVSTPLRAKSRLELLPAVAFNAGSSTAITVPDGYRSVAIKSTATSNVALTMPTGMFAGQELLLTWFNADTNQHNMTFATTPVTGTAIPNPVGAGETLTGVFVWEDRDASGSPSRWIQKGNWSVGLTLA